MTREYEHNDTARSGGSGSAGPKEDVVALLMAQHSEIRKLFDEVERTDGDARWDAFRHLVRYLAVHETAEEEVVHPYARRSVDDGTDVVRDRLAEEKKAKEILTELDSMDPKDPRFLPALARLRTAVTEHAQAEERYEFALLSGLNDPGRLAAMARGVRAAEAVAPTRPHPGVQSATANVLVGPVAAVVDRARDAVRRAAGEDG
ncbi:hemerythrin domain-containing protein [Streptomyces sp. NPDC000405]|uniref:hemerythrin domain-containing protein n=1 Tax=Streptomyces sp. NPDC000405 TaxID=3161033 RepID=UPI00398CF92E